LAGILAFENLNNPYALRKIIQDSCCQMSDSPQCCLPHYSAISSRENLRHGARQWR